MNKKLQATINETENIEQIRSSLQLAIALIEQTIFKKNVNRKRVMAKVKKQD